MSVINEPRSLQSYLDAESRSIVEDCVQCGRCVEVCPVISFGKAAGAETKQIIGGIIDLLASRSEALTPASEEWVSTCNGCGLCIPECPEAINPRKMLALAGAKQSTVSSKTPELFRRMSRSIKVLVGMQLIPAEFKKVFVPARVRDVPIVFYLGCNALRTPHLLFNSMALLDAVGAEYDVVGGPSSCCGVIATKWEGRVKAGDRIATSTVNRFEGFKPEKVLNWCPTCQLHLSETLDGYRKTSYDFDHVTDYLANRIEILKSKFIRPLKKRAVVHAYVGRSDICTNVNTLLRAIPEFEIVDTVYESGYTCGGSGCSKAPGLAQKEHGELLQRTIEAGADVLVTLYHGCHQTFIGAEKTGAFKVLNFTDVLVEALGQTPYFDQMKHYRLMDDFQMIIDEAQPLLKANGIEIDSEWLLQHGPSIFAGLEFKGQLECFGDPAHAEHKH